MRAQVAAGSRCDRDQITDTTLSSEVSTPARSKLPVDKGAITSSSPEDISGNSSIGTNNLAPTTAITAAATVCTTNWRTLTGDPCSTPNQLPAPIPIGPPSNLPLPSPFLLFSHSQSSQLQPTSSQFQVGNQPEFVWTPPNQQGIPRFISEPRQSGPSLVYPFTWVDQYRSYYYLYLQELAKVSPSRPSAFEKVPRRPSSQSMPTLQPQPSSSSMVPWQLCPVAQPSQPSEGQHSTRSTEEVEQTTVLDYSFKTLSHQHMT
ncbi:hypothetical protein SprV_0501925000 [Sparganum proliferum]